MSDSVKLTQLALAIEELRAENAKLNERLTKLEAASVKRTAAKAAPTGGLGITADGGDLALPATAASTPVVAKTPAKKANIFFSSEFTAKYSADASKCAAIAAVMAKVVTDNETAKTKKTPEKLASAQGTAIWSFMKAVADGKETVDATTAAFITALKARIVADCDAFNKNAAATATPATEADVETLTMEAIQ